MGHAWAAGLLVQPLAFRADRTFLPTNLRHRSCTDVDFAGALEEMKAYVHAGADALSCDHPDIAVMARHGSRVGIYPMGRAS